MGMVGENGRTNGPNPPIHRLNTALCLPLGNGLVLFNDPECLQKTGLVHLDAECPAQRWALPPSAVTIVSDCTVVVPLAT